MDLGNTQLHVPHGGDALSDEPRRVVLPLFNEPVVVSSDTSQTKFFTALFLKILIGDPDDVGEQHRSVHLFFVEYFQTLRSDVGGAGDFVPGSYLSFHAGDASQTAKSLRVSSQRPSLAAV